MDEPKYPGFQHVTFNELLEFVNRLVEKLDIDYRPKSDYLEHCAAAVYHEMTREGAGVFLGVSTEGAAWARDQIEGPPS